MDEIYEMRITVGAGYRVYYAKDGDITYLLLCGGDKSTQKKDIEKAVKLWREIKNG
ncbi:type II toxin-antitoxin system RelE/ParE family toxin [Gilliamella sp.]|uniref:type II toxin-antitoxin system RelE/ParE family toxin n=1 Tax=Gilliamella sp. TaxID=1891236 RepID=UPI002629EB41|nr:type II toxin-antitoxin system RelE/ParE family toxin [Gilliamella sp.]